MEDLRGEACLAGRWAADIPRDRALSTEFQPALNRGVRPWSQTDGTPSPHPARSHEDRRHSGSAARRGVLSLRAHPGRLLVNRRRSVWGSLIALLVAGAIFAQPGSSSRGAEGGILRISLTPASGLDPRRPRALVHPTRLGPSRCDVRSAHDLPGQAATGRLPTREGSRGRLPTSPKTSRPTPSRCARGFRFSDGSRVRASAFANAINRALQPARLRRVPSRAGHRRRVRRARRAADRRRPGSSRAETR